MSAYRFFLAAAALLFGCSACSRPRPVTVRDAPADKVMIVQESTRKDGLKDGDDIVSVIVRDGLRWRAERFFVRGQAVVYIFNGGGPGGGGKAAGQGEFSTESTLRTIHEFVTASRSRWFAYRGKVRHINEFVEQRTFARDERTFDDYEGRPRAGAPEAGRMRMYVNRANGLLEYQNCDRGDGVDVKAISYFAHKKLPADLFNPDDTRVRSFEFLDHQTILHYENLQVYEETMLPKPAGGGR